MSEITPARAMEILKNLNFRATGETKQANELAIEAIEKQIPQQTEAVKLKYGLMIENTAFGKGCTIYKCKCGTFVRPMQKYCSECGRLMSWEVNNDQ